MISRRLYSAIRSERHSEPDLIWPAPVPTAKSALNESALANLLMARVAVADAHFSGSLALWSDAGHLLLDVSGVALVLLAIRLGRQAPMTNTLMVTVVLKFLRRPQTP